ncbi:DUF2793 domain-containing protein [uncultured Algimonas sp.]|uniref:DUF2793 domain-containing protein n=1 Tax=uncultured Algimonas sp. TaxID=1547920 RepID=UPI00262D3454|nr:DUF2793 domain-containing protein [uncultured Algimonas sp.]
MARDIPQSPNLGLPLMAPAQAQKHLVVNDALLRLDALAQLRISALGVDDPPMVFAPGDAFATGSAPSGIFAGHPESLAFATGQGWRFQPLRPGIVGYDIQNDTLVQWSGTAWVAVGGQGSGSPDTIPKLGIGAPADPRHSLSVRGATTLFNAAPSGDGHRLVLNRPAAGGTSSCLFQTGLSGRAEIGMIGDETLSLQTSPDGTIWHRHASIAPDFKGLSAAALRSGQQSLAVDSMMDVATPGSGGIFALTLTDDGGYPQSHHSALMVYDTGASPVLTTLVALPGIRNLSAATLTGRSGPDGFTNIAVKTGALQIENRFQVQRQYSWTFLC